MSNAPCECCQLKMAKMVQLALIFIERITRIGRLAVDRERRAIRIGDARYLPGAIWNLKLAGGTREDGA